jgi:MYXO-CTERM domain-containing protein
MDMRLRSKMFVVSGLAAAACAAVAFVAPGRAEACGGTFCDGGPQPMPVDQSGENILFVRTADTIQAHIQIQYMGEPDQFAWVIPLQSVPTFSVGSEPLFQALLGASVPQYGFSQQFDDCSLGDDGAASGPPSDGDSAGAGEDGGGDGTGGEDPGPDILLMETVGAYEITVLSGGSAAEVITWLDENGYQQDPESEPILQEYLDENFLFGAVKLTSGAQTNEIHPIVLTFAGDEACIPLRLTRIAAVEDMDVRSFFLGQARTVPQVYKHVLVNPLKIDWINSADNYKEVISMAVDAPMSEGRAFVTEYAGPSNVVNTFGVHDPAWDPSAFATIDPIAVVDELGAQGLYFCDEFAFQCGGTHPLVQPLLDEFLPVPAGVDPYEFYSCLSCYEAMIDTAVWDAAAFSAALDTRIVAPGLNAVQVLEDNPYLTRLYTTISPGEMTADPLFWENASLPDITNQQTGTRRFLCNGDSVFTLPDGREVYLPAGTTDWPTFEDDPAWVQPWEEIVEETPNAGAPLELANQTAVIDAALAAYNAAHGWPGGGGDGGADDSGTGGGSAGSAGGGTDGSDTDGGPGASGSGGTESGGCGCRTASGPAGAAWGLVAFGAGLVLRRRRR